MPARLSPSTIFPYARVLADSFFAHHPGRAFTVLIVDDEGRQFDDRQEPFTWLRLRDIGLEPEEIRRLAGIYDVTELATAVKPLLLRRLLEDQSHIVYLDPDIRIYGSLSQRRSWRTRHRADAAYDAPLPRDGRRIDAF